MNRERLKRIIAIMEPVNVPVEVPPHAKAIMEAAIEKFCIRTLSEKEMRSVILKILNLGRCDGGQVAQRLSELRVRLEQDGEGMIFALLANMAREGLIAGSFDSGMTQKTYFITDNGSSVLQREESTIRSMGNVVPEPSLIRIPPGVRFDFEQEAAKICDGARVDHDDRPFLVHEWVLRLEHLWRAGIESGLANDDATKRAWLLFGEPAKIIMLLKNGVRGAIRRFFSFERYRLWRYIWIIASAQLIEFIRLARSFEFSTTRTQYLLYGSNIYEGVGIIVFLALWNSRDQLVWHTFKGIFRFLSLILAVYLEFQLLQRYWGVWVDLFRLSHWDGEEWADVLWMAMLVPITLVGLICFFIEAVGIRKLRSNARSA